MDEENKNKTPKELETEKRLAEVERYLVRRFSVQDIANILKVSTRTIDRDVATIRSRNLKIFEDEMMVRSWVRKEWADAVSALNEAERMFWQLASSASSDATKARSIWYVVQTISTRNQILESIGFSATYKKMLMTGLYQPFEADRFADERLDTQDNGMD